jgi:hypothetical protein
MTTVKTINYVPLPTDQVRDFQRGKIDSNGLVPERVSQGGGPCRHCLSQIQPNEEKLVLGYRPFPSLQPYAETGPIFLHAKECEAYNDRSVLPAMFEGMPDVLMIARGYDHNDRIEYGAMSVVAVNQLENCCSDLVKNERVAYIHVRFAATNCYQFRVERGKV